MTTFEGRNSAYPIDVLFLKRWSPRAFTGEEMPAETLMTIFEAARWAPSSFNSQPWRFVYAFRDTPEFSRIVGLLVPQNQAWAASSSVLTVVVSKTTMAPRGNEVPSYSHSFDAGAAWQNLSLQATLLGWHTHGMTGLDMPRAASELGVPKDYRVEAAIAIGRQADKSILPEPYRSMEAPSDRQAVSAFAFEGLFRVI